MKKFLLLLFVSIVVLKAQSYEDYLNKLIKTEYKFSEWASVVGIRNSFLEFIADDGILFRPNPVNGKEFLANQKNPSKGLLSWYPEVVFLSLSKDFGFTTGPWEYRKEKDSSAIAYGNFATIWELQIDGSYKFAIDIGNYNNAPKQKVSGLNFINSQFTSAQSNVIHGDKNIICAVDDDFNNQLNEHEFHSAYKKYSDTTTRLLREGSYPIDGVDNIETFVDSVKGDYKFKMTDGEVSHAQDLGYTYGIVERSDEKNITTKYNYMRVYIKRSDQWKLALEVYNQIPD